MTRIEQAFARAPATVAPGSATAPLLNLYFTAGYPHLASTGELLRVLGEEDVDLIELGLPYSDPLADGETIQGSGARALANGITLDRIFAQVAEARAAVPQPIFAMGYYNQVMRFGKERFLDACVAAGIDGLILPDLPPDVYREEFREAIERRELGIAFLVTPRTPAERVREIDALCRGFLYVVSSSSTTGTEKVAERGRNPSPPPPRESAEAYFERLNTMDLRSPRLIGFNISTADQLRATTRHAAGGIIGSAFIRALDPERTAQSAREFIRGLRATETKT